MNKLLASLALLLPLAAFTAPVAAQALAADPLDRIVAVVEEDVILQSELDRAVRNVMAQFQSRGDLPPRDVIERQVLERLITMRLQLQRAEGTGIRVSDTELDQAVMRIAQQNGATLDQLRASLERDGYTFAEFRDTMRDELMVQRLRTRYVQSRVNVTDTEIDILLASGGLKRGEVRLAHIMIAVPDGAAPDEIRAARERAESVRREIAGGLDFSAAAIRHSDGQQALEGGDLGWRRFDEVPTVFADVVASLAVGEVTPVMRGPSGFHILKLTDQREEQAQIVREYHVQHIMVKTSEVVTGEEALASIRNIRQRLQDGEDFAKLAKEFSEDVSSQNQGGDLGWIAIDQYGTRFGEVVGSLADGELSQPFQTEVGWHLVKRIATRDQDRTEETLRNQAAQTIRNRKAEEEYEAFVRSIRNESYIENRLTDTVSGGDSRS
jgi:peptidyl-prolyl cis-trans isomerase SurA